MNSLKLLNPAFLTIWLNDIWVLVLVLLLVFPELDLLLPCSWVF